jgi:crotonobetainyl-CoA:carnitine CoA-transferase CaiB-like acyl-CoA transferase
MLDCQMSMMNYMATMYSMSGDIPKPMGNSHFVHVPYDTFKTKTDMIVIACVGEKFWPLLLDLIEDDALRDKRFEFAPGRLAEKEYITERINKKLAQQDADYWLERLEQARIPCARVNNIAQALKDPQIIARNMNVEVFHPVSGSAHIPGNPIKLSDTDGDTFSPPPLLGAHNEEVMQDWLVRNKD